MRYTGKNVRLALQSFVKEDQRRGKWWAADRYDVRRTTDGKWCIVSPYGQPSGSSPPGWNGYSPLISHQHLFLEFARLAERMDPPVPPKVDPDTGHHIIYPSFPPETDNNTEIALRWAEGYGVLGLTHDKGNYPDPRGGEKDTVEAFCDEATWAYRALTLYEAATDPNEVDVDFIASDDNAP